MARSRGARRAPAGPARARSARRTGAVVAWPTARSRATTGSARPRRWCASRCARALSDRAAEQGRRRRRLGHRRAAHQGRGRAARRARAARRRASATDAGARGARPLRGRGVEVVPQPRRAGADRAARRAQHLRRARQRLARLLPGDARRRTVARLSATGEVGRPERRTIDEAPTPRPTRATAPTTDGGADDEPRPARHHHAAGRVGEVVRRVRRRTSTRSSSRPTPTRSRSARRSRRSSTCASPT